jgi:hypothetical protein
MHNSLLRNGFVAESMAVHGDRYQYPRNCISSDSRMVNIICREHGLFRQRSSDHLSGHGCRACADILVTQKNTYTFADFLAKALVKHGTKYTYLESTYIRCDLPLTMVCPKHGEFIQVGSRHLSGSGCPRCRRSMGEKAVRAWLDQYPIKYIHRWYPKGLIINVKGGEIDFYLPDYEIAIEYDGEQHFRAIQRGKKMTMEQAWANFGKTKFSDAKKTEWCIKNEIDLLRVSYLESVQEKLDEVLLPKLFIPGRVSEQLQLTLN